MQQSYRMLPRRVKSDRLLAGPVHFAAAFRTTASTGAVVHFAAAVYKAAGFTIRAQIIWAKSRLVLGRGHYHWQHEPCFYAVRDCKTGHWQGARDQTTLWSVATIGGEEDAATMHGTQKPVEVMRRPMLNNSVASDLVYEPFCGSGSTIIAAETVGRVCLAMEISPDYCDVAVLRWQKFTGRDVVRASDGQTFNTIATARGTSLVEAAT